MLHERGRGPDRVRMLVRPSPCRPLPSRRLTDLSIVVDAPMMDRCWTEHVLNLIEPRLTTNAVIVCPASGQLVPTGVSADALLDDATRYVLVRCGGCGGEHMWLPDDAIVTATRRSLVTEGELEAYIAAAYRN